MPLLRHIALARGGLYTADNTLSAKAKDCASYDKSRARE